jgi:hypothetical protein
VNVETGWGRGAAENSTGAHALRLIPRIRKATIDIIL